MAVLLRHRHPGFWTPQRVPTEAVELDGRHPLSNGIIGLYVPGKTYSDLSRSNNNGTANGSPSIAASPYGPALSLNGSSQWLDIGSTSRINVPIFTRSALVFANSLSAFNSIISDNTGGAEFRINSSSGILELDVTGTALIGTSSSAVAVGTWTQTAVTYDSAGNYAFYINGKLSGSGTNLKSFTMPQRMAIGGAFSNGFNTNNFNGLIAQAAVFNRALSGQEVFQLHQEPFSMLRPQARRTYSIIVTVVDTTTLPGVGALSYGGLAPSVSAGATSLPSAGTVTVTGFAPSIISATAIFPAAGLVAFNGQAPTISTEVPVGRDQITASGFAPAVRAGTSLLPNAGAVSVTGLPPTLVVISAGALSLTQNPDTLVAASTVNLLGTLSTAQSDQGVSATGGSSILAALSEIQVDQSFPNSVNGVLNRPQSSNTLTLVGVAVPMRRKAAPLTTYIFEDKYSSDVSGFTFNLAAWLGDNDTLEGIPAATVTPDGASVQATVASGNVVTVWIGGGSINTNYTIELEARTSSNRGCKIRGTFGVEA